MASRTTGRSGQKKTEDKPRAKNPVGDVVKWFYEEWIGVKPDRGVYARFMDKKNPRSLYHLMIEEPDEPGGDVVYTMEDVVELVKLLRSRGVSVTTLGVVTIPGLLFNFKNKDKLSSCERDFESIVEYLRAGQSESGGSFDAPPGW